MARLLKERAKRPVICNGATYIGTKAIWLSGECDDFYTLVIGDHDGGPAYEVELSEEEMLSIASAWLGKMHVLRRQRTCRNCKARSSDLRGGLCGTCREMTP